MGVFRSVGHIHFDQKGGDKMINIGIDVHKKTCVAAVKDDSGKLLERSKFENSVLATTNFATYLKEQYRGQLPIKVVCESTANY